MKRCSSVSFFLASRPRTRCTPIDLSCFPPSFQPCFFISCLTRLCTVSEIAGLYSRGAGEPRRMDGRMVDTETERAGDALLV